MKSARRSPAVVRNTVRAWRDVEPMNNNLRNFSDRVGRAIAGAGMTRSLGSMSLTLLGGAEFDRLRQRMTANDQRAIDERELSAAIDDELRCRPSKIDLSTDGIGLFGVKFGRTWEPVAKLGFRALLGDNSAVIEDLEVINRVLSDFNIPAVGTAPLRTLRVTFGDVYTEHISRGQGDNPNLLIPSGVCIPASIPMSEAQADRVIGGGKGQYE